MQQRLGGCCSERHRAFLLSAIDYAQALEYSRLERERCDWISAVADRNARRLLVKRGLSLHVLVLSVITRNQHLGMAVQRELLV